MEESLLKEGHEIRVEAQGRDRRILTVKWSQMGAQFVYKFTADDRLIKKLQNAGFRHIYFDNGDRFWHQGSNNFGPTRVGFVARRTGYTHSCIRRVIAIGRRSARRHSYEVVAELAEHQVVSSRGAT
jgi:hypothetical protein